MQESPRRLVPERTFPPYAYTGDPQPHPARHPDGHSFGVPEEAPGPLVSERWQESRAYLHGFDLFNWGYYWEAHEAWEGLWNAAGRRGAAAEFFKGLIKLAAAGVKVRQGMASGVRKHARRAIAHFGRVADAGEREFAGFVLADLLAFATRIETEAANWPKMEGDGPAVVFDQPLVPRLRSDTGCHDPR